MIEISETKFEFFKRRILGWAKVNFKGFPWRDTENKWHALIAEIMLQRTRAEQVVNVYENFTKKYINPREFLLNNEENIFKSLGLPERNTSLKKLNEILVDSEIPATKNELIKLPGVGDYIASAMLSLHLNKRAAIIDSNVVRIYGRYFGFETNGETRRKKWFIELAELITPSRAFRKYNYGIIDFTREICKPKPLCLSCPLKKKCSFLNAPKV